MADTMQSGLSMFLAILAVIFVSGLILFAFVLVGSNLQANSNVYLSQGPITDTEELTLMNGSIGYFDLTVASYRSVLCTITAIYNSSNPATVINSGNYTQSNCRISVTQGAVYNDSTWNTSYSYTYEIPSEAHAVVGNTTASIADATDWFPTFIVVGAVIVLILLITLIINSLRGSGLMGEGNA